MAKDMSAPNWKRTHARLSRNIEELQDQGCRVITPAEFEKPPGRRSTALQGSSAIVVVANPANESE